MKVYKKPIPPESLIAHALPRIDYQDNYTIQVSAEQEVQPAELVKLFFQSFPKWFMALLYTREQIAKWIGLKTAHGMDVQGQLEAFQGQEGESIALFHVLGSSDREVMLGENDKHLDFRFSFLVNPTDDQQELCGATTVQYNGWLGRIYFFFVKPVHRLIMRVMMLRIGKRLGEG